MSIKKVIFFFFALLWPHNLLKANTLPDFLSYLIPPVLLGVAFHLFKKSRDYFLLPIIIIPIFSSKLMLLPIFTVLTYLFMTKKKKYLLYLLISLLILLFGFKSFWGQTIFIRDYEARQTVIRNTYLYPNVLLARTFQNKVKIITDKFCSNLVALIDPTNYFFGFHPREITIDNQNLYKFSFLSFPFFLLGIYHLNKNRYRSFIIPILISTLVSLSFLTNFDRNDFVLVTPLLLILYHGIEIVFKKL